MLGGANAHTYSLVCYCLVFGLIAMLKKTMFNLLLRVYNMLYMYSLPQYTADVYHHLQNLSFSVTKS